jgi:hypothetical protein
VDHFILDEELSPRRMDVIIFSNKWVEHKPYKTTNVKVVLLFLVFWGYKILMMKFL